MNLAGAASEVLQGEIVSADYFGVLGVPARAGRVFTDSDNDHQIVLSDACWRRRFGASPEAVGRTLVVNGSSFTIAGIAPEDFTGTSVGLFAPDFWAPLSAQQELAPGTAWRVEPAQAKLQLLARVNSGTSIRQAQVETDSLVRQFDGTGFESEARTTLVTLQRASYLGNTEDPRFQAAVGGVMFLVALVLLASCANISNILLARGVARQREIAMRLALGASRYRVVRYLMTESLVLSVLGGLAGLAVAIWASKALWVYLQNLLAGPLGGAWMRHLDFHPDWRIVAYAAGISLLAAVAFGLTPAWQSARGAHLNSSLKGEGVLGVSIRRSRFRHALIAFQVLVSTVFVVSAGLFTRGMTRSLVADPGFETLRVLMVMAQFDSTPDKAARQERRLADTLRAIPGVASVSLGQVPLAGTWTIPVRLDPRDGRPDRTLASVASETYFATLGIGLMRGRLFTAQEARSGDHVAVVSQATAHRFWPNDDPIGKRFRLMLHYDKPDLTEFEVIGVVRDTRAANLTRVDPARVYMPTSDAERYPLLVRLDGDIARTTASVRSAVMKVDTAARLVSLADGPLAIQRSISGLLAWVCVGLAGLTMLITSAGIYGVIAFVVNQRVKEIGIRMALGASARALLKSVVLAGLAPVFVAHGSGHRSQRRPLLRAPFRRGLARIERPLVRPAVLRSGHVRRNSSLVDQRCDTGERVAGTTCAERGSRRCPERSVDSQRTPQRPGGCRWSSPPSDGVQRAKGRRTTNSRAASGDDGHEPTPPKLPAGGR